MTKKILDTIKLSGKLLTLIFCLITITRADVFYEISNKTSAPTKVNIFLCAENKEGEIKNSSDHIWAQIWLKPDEKWKIGFPKDSPNNQYICAEPATAKWHIPDLKTLVMGLGKKRHPISEFRIVK